MRAAVPSFRGASSVVEQRAQSKAEAEAVKDPTAATRWSERQYTARLEVRTLSAAPKLRWSLERASGTSFGELDAKLQARRIVCCAILCSPR